VPSRHRSSKSAPGIDKARLRSSAASSFHHHSVKVSMLGVGSDELQFLGSRPAQIQTSDQPMGSAQRPVTGIALHVEKSGSNDAYGMIFQRTNTGVVHIGRRPCTEIDRRSQDNELDKAMFRCDVMSRKHAKITFSDSGNAYLIDLNSHHGTHVRKSGDIISNSLKPETPLLLSNGDFITFGKSVEKNEECIRPIVVRVELL